MNLKYDALHHLQVGRIGEYWMKLTLTTHGFDTYYCDVDNKAIDFIVRLDNSKHIDIQVKTIRLKSSSYVFITKGNDDAHSWSNKDIARSNLYLGLVVLSDDDYPKSYLIPSSTWVDPSSMFVNKKYQERGLKSKDEWGLNISKKNLHLLEPFRVDKQCELWKDK